MIWVLCGLGIECEKESELFFRKLGYPVQRLWISQLSGWNSLSTGDWVFIPGGFSFSDHFGSGRLLAYELSRLNFWKKTLDAGAHLMGVCNGFQTLVESGLFGESTQLLHNQPPGFVDRWVSLEHRSGDQRRALRLPVRHGEGRLVLDPDTPVQAFLYYQDHFFNNGSQDQVAGVYRRLKNSWVVGMMPHPEIAWAKAKDPDCFASDVFVQHRAELLEARGDGVQLLQSLFEELK